MKLKNLGWSMDNVMDKMQSGVPQHIQVDATPRDYTPREESFRAQPTLFLKRGKTLSKIKQELVEMRKTVVTMETTERSRSVMHDDRDHDEENLIGKFKPKMTSEFEPMEILCPKCQETCITKVEVFYADISYIICIALFFLCLWFICWLPFYLAKKQKKLLKDCQHRCPKCFTLLAHQRRA